VALHDGGFEDHWHTLGMEPYDPDGGLYGERFEATDDLGTEYRATGAGGSFSSYSERNGSFVALGQTGCAPRYRRAHGNFASGGLPRSGWLDSPEPVRAPACLADPPSEQPYP
jgi:hypothetical protein